jgi:hypothetical protein
MTQRCNRNTKTRITWVSLLVVLASVFTGAAFAQDQAAADTLLAEIRGDFDALWESDPDAVSGAATIAAYNDLRRKIDRLFELEPNIHERDATVRREMMLCDVHDGIAVESLGMEDYEAAQVNIEACVQLINQLGQPALQFSSPTYIFHTMSRFWADQGQEAQRLDAHGNMMGALLQSLPYVDIEVWTATAEMVVPEFFDGIEGLIDRVAETTGSNSRSGSGLERLTDQGQAARQRLAAQMNIPVTLMGNLLNQNGIPEARRVAALAVIMGGFGNWLDSEDIDVNAELVIAMPLTRMVVISFASGIFTEMTGVTEAQAREEIHNDLIAAVQTLLSDDDLDMNFDEKLTVFNELANLSNFMTEDTSASVLPDFSVDSFQKYVTHHLYASIAAFRDSGPAPQYDDLLYFARLKARWSEIISQSVSDGEIGDFVSSRLSSIHDCIAYFHASEGPMNNGLIARRSFASDQDPRLNWNGVSLFPAHAVALVVAALEMGAENAPYLASNRGGLLNTINRQLEDRDNNADMCEALALEYRGYDASLLNDLSN